MSVRHLYLVRHGWADAFGELTDVGRTQMGHVGRRLSRLPIDAVWHSPLPRAQASAAEVGRYLPGVPVMPAAELIDHVPFVPPPAQMPQAWAGFFDGWDPQDADRGRAVAQALTDRFTVAPGQADPDTHEVLITHEYPIAWLVADAFGAPPVRWLGLSSANGALSVVTYRTGQDPTLVVFNDMGHLPEQLRWTGFPKAVLP